MDSTVPSRKTYMDGTVQSSKKYLDGTVPSSKKLVDGTVPSCKKLVEGTISVVNITKLMKQILSGTVIYIYIFISVTWDFIT